MTLSCTACVIQNVNPDHRNLLLNIQVCSLIYTLNHKVNPAHINVLYKADTGLYCTNFLNKGYWGDVM